MLITSTALSIQVTAAPNTLDIRHQFLWPSRTRSECILAEDAEWCHLGAVMGELLVAVGSLFRRAEGLRARRFATLHQWLGRGIGTTLLQHAMALAHETGVGITVMGWTAPPSAFVVP